jgi:nucleotide-binding universal stress UspA family protein
MEYYPPPESFNDTIEREVRKQLDAALTAEEQAKYRPVLAYRTGLPALEILAYLRERPTIDLVIMATHGRGAVARLMLGSVADKVVRAAPCPVLTLREAEKPGEQARSAA